MGLELCLELELELGLKTRLGLLWLGLAGVKIGLVLGIKLG